MEYIFVDDGSSDSSLWILQKSIVEHNVPEKKVKIIRNSQNKGTGFSRNAGLMAAEGEFIIYFDSDDWIEPFIYKKLYIKAIETNSDIVGCDFYFEKANKQKIAKQIFLSSGEGCIRKALKGKLFNAMWNKLIKKRYLWITALNFLPT